MMYYDRFWRWPVHYSDLRWSEKNLLYEIWNKTGIRDIVLGWNWKGNFITSYLPPIHSNGTSDDIKMYLAASPYIWSYGTRFRYTKLLDSRSLTEMDQTRTFNRLVSVDSGLVIRDCENGLKMILDGCVSSHRDVMLHNSDFSYSILV